MSIESLILLSGLKEVAVTRYIACLCLQDPDPFIRHSTSLALFNFVAVACRQIEMSKNATDARRGALKEQALVMMECWEPITIERMEVRVFRYLAKIIELVREIAQDVEAFKFTLPVFATGGPVLQVKFFLNCFYSHIM